MSAPENLYRRFVDAQEEAKRLSERLARLEETLRLDDEARRGREVSA